MTVEQKWWKEATVYQIWPASYKDSNNDGIGDLGGIVDKIEYIKRLGIDVIWLSPMYESPQDDMGYDISDYNAIYEKYGTMHQMDELIQKVHDAGMRLILDLVINHTSSQHAWFQESRSSLDNPKRDWYVWKKPKYDAQGVKQPPNNWQSYFGGSAWQYDDLTGEYYLRLFAPTQPDLNWENDECKNAIYESAIKFWMKKGVDGFRIDTAGLYSKRDYEDAPILFPETKYQPVFPTVLNGPKIHQYHKEINQILSDYDFMTVGEIGYGDKEENLRYVRASSNEMSMIFLFDAITIGYVNDDRFRYEPYTFQDFKQAFKTQSDFIKGTDAWSTVFIENHDQPRSVTRFGDCSKLSNIFKSAKLLAMLQCALTGTLFVYQGQEIAMTNLPESWDIREYLDVNTIQYYRETIKEFGAHDPRIETVKNLLSLVARDHARSPVQWNNTTYGGFSEAKPWMRVNDNYTDINVELQLQDELSVLHFWEHALKIRKMYKNSLIYGDFEVLDMGNDHVFSFVKRAANQKVYVVLNFSGKAVELPKLVDWEDYEMVLSNGEGVGELGAWEGRYYKLLGTPVI